VLWLSLVAALACGGGAAPARTTPTPAPPPAPGIKRIADANTAALLLTSNNADLAAARIAVTRAKSRDVKLLARNIVTDHTSLGTRLSRLVASINLSPRDDEVSRLLRDQSAARRDTLRKLSGYQFDSTYVENEVRFQEELLVAIDRVFLPSVRNARLREYITSMRPTIVLHRALAEQVQATIDAPR
jgi:putative membrane protein